MATSLETLDVVALLILDAEGRILLDYNENWHTFTLPMSKRHTVLTSTPGDVNLEELDATALRAAVEVIGRPLMTMPKRIHAEVPPWNQSGRDGTWRRYQYHVFALRSPGVPTPLPGHTAVWLTLAELEVAEPVSRTVRTILGAVPFADVKKAVGL
jgi:hypothetical protein